MSKETGGPAFPVDGIVERDEKGHLHGPIISSAGSTLRDYFAAKVMQGTQTNPEWNHWSTEQHAEYAYGAADAMLKARNN
ncbi:hypothetical protein [Serratia inhibens]|uniref:hypothetical protein n=1 Tax=Serratia inhibens TaxID=2338073 RepID=UPI003217AAB2